MSDLRQSILDCPDSKVEPVEVPEWANVEVYVRSLTAGERDMFEESFRDEDGKRRDLKDFRAKFAALSLCDKHGARIFTDNDVAALSLKSAAALDRVLDAGRALSGMDDDSITELEKNSEETPDANSTSS